MSFVIHHPDLDTDKVVPEHTLGTYARKGWVIAGRRAEAAAPARPEMEMPNRSATTAEWRTYAVVSGMSYDAAMGMKRDELADKYDPQPERSDETPPAKPPRKRAPRPTPAAPAPTPPPSAEIPADAVTTADTPQES